MLLSLHRIIQLVLLTLLNRLSIVVNLTALIALLLTDVPLHLRHSAGLENGVAFLEFGWGEVVLDLGEIERMLGYGCVIAFHLIGFQFQF